MTKVKAHGLNELWSTIIFQGCSRPLMIVFDKKQLLEVDGGQKSDEGNWGQPCMMVSMAILVLHVNKSGVKGGFNVRIGKKE